MPGQRVGGGASCRDLPRFDQEASGEACDQAASTPRRAGQLPEADQERPERGPATAPGWSRGEPAQTLVRSSGRGIGNVCLTTLMVLPPRPCTSGKATEHRVGQAKDDIGARGEQQAREDTLRRSGRRSGPSGATASWATENAETSTSTTVALAPRSVAQKRCWTSWRVPPCPRMPSRTGPSDLSRFSSRSMVYRVGEQNEPGPIHERKASAEAVMSGFAGRRLRRQPRQGRERYTSSQRATAEMKETEDHAAPNTPALLPTSRSGLAQVAEGQLLGMAMQKKMMPIPASAIRRPHAEAGKEFESQPSGMARAPKPANAATARATCRHGSRSR